jgi:hypothetical protein
VANIDKLGVCSASGGAGNIVSTEVLGTEY